MTTIPAGFAGVLLPLKHSLLSRSAAITFGVDVTGATGTHTQICDEVLASFAATLGAVLDFDVTAGPVHMAFGQDDGSSIQEVGVNTWKLGVTQTSTPPAVAVLVRKATATGGKRGRGRFYLPWCVATTSIDEGGNVSSAALTNLQTKATAFKTQLAATPSPTPMVLLHQVGSSTPSPVTGLSVDSRVASQRRRQGR
jgi:hypothetical protein